MAPVQSQSDHLLECISDLDARLEAITDQANRIEMDIQGLRAQLARLDADYDRISALRDELETLWKTVSLLAMSPALPVVLKTT